jgi:amino acid adenylation domain-containing protein
MHCSSHLRSLVTAFGHSVSTAGGHAAVIDGDLALTYDRLDILSDSYAQRLVKVGVRAGDRVGVFMDRSAEAVVAILAVLKACATYLPFDPMAPADRRAQQAAHAGIDVLMTRPRDNAAVWFQGHIEPVDLTAAPDTQAPPLEIHAVATDAIAMVLYTSGSTNEPKGVEIRHDSVLNLIEGADYCGMRPDDVVAHTMSLGFDGATLEIWGALLAGATLVIVAPGWTFSGLCDLVEARRITVLFVTTGVFNGFGRSEMKRLAARLRVLLTGGDVISAASARQFLALGGQRLVNGYGPTETTTFSHVHVMTSADAVVDPVPIGMPVNGATAYVLDAEGRRAADDEQGEIVIGGLGLARGYLADAARTAERFTSRLAGADGRVYRTGDFGRRDGHGVFHFAGRIDGQIKLNGFRIELGEIETCLRETGTLKDVAVIRVRQGERAWLAAFCVVETDAAEDDAQASLLAHVRRCLPPYMIPRRLTLLPALPLTLNGKLDRRALEATALEAGAWEGEPMAATSADPVSDAVLTILKDLLAVSALPLETNLFEAGADSLMAMKFIARLRPAIGADLPLGAVFHAETIADLIAAARAAGAGQAAPMHAVSL